MYSGPVIDCDVHHARNTDAELIDYLSRGWREYVTDRGRAGTVPLTVQDGLPNPHGFMRGDTYPEGGGEPGSDYLTMRRQLLDATDVRRAILTFGDDSHLAGHHNPYFANELARAANDWSIDRWLTRDPRLLSSIMVGSQMPDVAAAEVEPQIIAGQHLGRGQRRHRRRESGPDPALERHQMGTRGQPKAGDLQRAQRGECRVRTRCLGGGIQRFRQHRNLSNALGWHELEECGNSQRRRGHKQVERRAGASTERCVGGGLFHAGCTS